MAVYALVGNKGGSGKTTLCLNLAGALQRRGPTLVLDADPQRSSVQWREIADRDELFSAIDAVDGVADAVNEYRDQFDNILIDCPPSVQSEQTHQAFSVANKAIIPVLPSPLDLWASVHIEGEIESAREKNPGLKALLVVNQLEPRTRLSKMVRQALHEISLPMARTPLHRRVAYRNAILEGRTVSEMGAPGAMAKAEIEKLLTEILE